MKPCNDSTRLGLTVVLSLGAALGANAATRIYPSPTTPCNSSLQACIDGVDSGDTIVLTTDGYIAEDVLIRKNLSVMRAMALPSVRSITALADTNDVEVTVSGLTSNGGPSRVRGVLEPGGGNLRLTVTHSTLRSEGFNSALEVFTSNRAGRYGNARARFERNTVIQGSSGSFCGSAITADARNPGLSVDIIGNTVTASRLATCAAINLYGSGVPADGTWSLDAQVRKNTVTGDGAREGILVRGGPNGGRVRAAVVDNLVVGSGFESGLKAMGDLSNSAVEVRLLNNTVVDAQTGLHASARTDLGARVTGEVANNLFVHHAVAGLFIENAPNLIDHHNLIFASPRIPRARPYGPNTRHGDPSFANATHGDYRLRADSDAIDHGDDGAVDSPDGLDLDGQSRRVRTVDMGAYEFQGVPTAPGDPSQSIAGVPTLGAWGLGALAAALGALGARARRPRQGFERPMA